MVSIAVKSQQLLFIIAPTTRSEKESTLDCTQEEEVRKTKSFTDADSHLVFCRGHLKCETGYGY